MPYRKESRVRDRNESEVRDKKHRAETVEGAHFSGLSSSSSDSTSSSARETSSRSSSSSSSRQSSPVSTSRSVRCDSPSALHLLNIHSTLLSIQAQVDKTYRATGVDFEILNNGQRNTTK